MHAAGISALEEQDVEVLVAVSLAPPSTNLTISDFAQPSASAQGGATTATNARSRQEAVRRYERPLPGEMIDIRKLKRFSCVDHRITGDSTSSSDSRGIVWEFVYVSTDEVSRIAVSSILFD